MRTSRRRKQCSTIGKTVPAINYKPTYCEETGREQGAHRFVLEQAGERMLFVIGLNPSTANEERPDPTLRKVTQFAANAGYDGFTMLNLSSERATDKWSMSPVLNEEMHRRNLDGIVRLAKRYPTADILVAFGNDIVVKPYLKRCFCDIHAVLHRHPGRWLKIGAPTTKGNPRHPLYAPYASGLTAFDIADYIAKLQ